MLSWFIDAIETLVIKYNELAQKEWVEKMTFNTIANARISLEENNKK